MEMLRKAPARPQAVIVDPSGDERALIALILRRLGFTVMAAGDWDAVEVEAIGPEAILVVDARRAPPAVLAGRRTLTLATGGTPQPGVLVRIGRYWESLTEWALKS